MNEGEIDLSSDSPSLVAAVSGSRDVILVITEATVEKPTLTAAAWSQKTAVILIKQKVQTSVWNGFWESINPRQMRSHCRYSPMLNLNYVYNTKYVSSVITAFNFQAFTCSGSVWIIKSIIKNTWGITWSFFFLRTRYVFTKEWLTPQTERYPPLSQE